jgi:hypothetical protein
MPNEGETRKLTPSETQPELASPDVASAIARSTGPDQSRHSVLDLNAVAALQTELLRLAAQISELRRTVATLERDLGTVRNRTRELSIELRQISQGLPSVDGFENGAVNSASSTPHRIHRGENTRQMRAYADEIGGDLLPTEGVRCSHCSHVNGWFVRKGAGRLCQVCFGKGVRF